MIDYDVYHGTGNDFAVVDADEPVDVDAFGTALCGRLGVDGTLFVGVDESTVETGRSADPEGDAPGVRATMTLVQPDGSRAAMCGNGARVAARWVAERTDAAVVTLDTGAGPRRCTLDGDTVTVEMGVPSFAPDAVPLAGSEELVRADVEGYTITAVNTGVPHAVAFVDDVDAVDLESDAPPIRHSDLFPEGANVNVAAPRDGGFAQRTFERGVEGETEACGTGAVAIAVVAARLGKTPPHGTVTVSPPGGDLEIGLRPDGTTTLRGPTSFVRADAADPEELHA